MIIVHSKVTIIDDRVLRAGSTNLNHRSAGFDTECDVALEAETDEARAAITAFRAHLVGHFLGVGEADIEAAIEREGGLGKAIDALNVHSPQRLLPLPKVKMGPVARVVAAYHLGDPVYPSDSWRPLLRRARLHEFEQALEGASLGRRPSGKLEIDDQG